MSTSRIRAVNMQPGRERRRGRIVVTASLLTLAACGTEPGREPGGQDEQPEAPAPDTTTAIQPVPPEDSLPVDWTAGITLHAASGASGTAVVTGLRTGTHEGYDRVTIEFDPGPSLPGYHIEYIDRPLHECGSGRQIYPVGDAWLEIRLDGAAAHTDAGEPTLQERETEAVGAFLRRIYRTCDFEGVVTFVVALSAPQRYRVLDLAQPTRLVIDFRH